MHAPHTGRGVGLIRGQLCPIAHLAPIMTPNTSSATRPRRAFFAASTLFLLATVAVAARTAPVDEDDDAPTPAAVAIASTRSEAFLELVEECSDGMVAKLLEQRTAEEDRRVAFLDFDGSKTSGLRDAKAFLVSRVDQSLMDADGLTATSRGALEFALRSPGLMMRGFAELLDPKTLEALNESLAQNGSRPDYLMWGEVTEVAEESKEGQRQVRITMALMAFDGTDGGKVAEQAGERIVLYPSEAPPAREGRESEAEPDYSDDYIELVQGSLGPLAAALLARGEEGEINRIAVLDVDSRANVSTWDAKPLFMDVIETLLLGTAGVTTIGQRSLQAARREAGVFSMRDLADPKVRAAFVEVFGSSGAQPNYLVTGTLTSMTNKAPDGTRSLRLRLTFEAIDSTTGRLVGMVSSERIATGAADDGSDSSDE